jgi:hypothetical protein
LLVSSENEAACLDKIPKNPSQVGCLVILTQIGNSLLGSPPVNETIEELKFAEAVADLMPADGLCSGPLHRP